MTRGTLLRRLSDRRALLAIGAILALVVALLLAARGAGSGGFARAEVVLDTPTSQVVDADPAGADTLPWRASLMIHLLASQELKQQLAERAGIASDQLMVVDPGLDEPEVAASLPDAATIAAGSGVEPYVLTAFVRDESLPIISIEAAAPSKEQAQRLAAAATETLKKQLPPVQPGADLTSAEAEDEEVTPIPTSAQGIVVDQIGSVRAKTVDAAADPMKALGPALLVFLLWTAGVMAGPPLMRALTGARRRPRTA